MLYFWCLGITERIALAWAGVSSFCCYKNKFPKTSTFFTKERIHFCYLFCYLYSETSYVFDVVKYLKLLKSGLPKSGKIAYLNQTLASISIAVVHTVYALRLTGTRNYCKIPIHFSAGSRRGALNHAWFCFCAFVQCLDALLWLFCYFENHLSWNKTVFWYLISNL